MERIKPKVNILVSFFLILVIFSGCSSSNDPETQEWTLAWSDEFTGESGTLPNSNYWNLDIGTDWGNAQLEYDTDRPENVSLDGNGNLVITAIKENYESRSYTSARITTKDKFEQTYGKIEARIKMPYGAGIWPAFWMLGADIDDVGWPQCGEIDIMEFRGQEPSTIHGSLHGPGYSGGQPKTKRYDLTAARFDTDFHTFAVEWGNDFIRWYVDGNLYQSVSPGDVNGEWVFDHDFFIILNLAVGGNYVGWPNDQTVFPQQMTIDYVRVYK